MARPLRIEIENGLYHVTSRGWERRVIVKDDRDREKWMQLLDRVAGRFGWQFFAWTLMDNHFHLFLRTPNADLSAGMHDLNSGYASWFNKRHRRVGSLFQGRFKAILVENDSYAWTLSRYLHLNPVRAGIVKRPESEKVSGTNGTSAFAVRTYGARRPDAYEPTLDRFAGATCLTHLSRPEWMSYSGA